MSVDSDFAEGSFGNPCVDEDLLDCVVEYFMENGSSYSWEVISEVSDSEGVPKKSVRRCLRKLRLSKRVVPDSPFVGKLCLCEFLDDV
jgi:hypothetical protein